MEKRKFDPMEIRAKEKSESDPMEPGQKTYYEILGVDRQADDKEIKSRYRALARENHPDVTGNDPVKEAAFKDIAEAYRVLSDPEKRSAYDATTEEVEASYNSATSWDSIWQTKPDNSHPPKTSGSDSPRIRGIKITDQDVYPSLEVGCNLGASFFKPWLKTFLSMGITQERLMELLNSPKAQKIMRANFKYKINISDCIDQTWPVQRIQEWQGSGIDLKPLLAHVEIQKELAAKAWEAITVWGKESSQVFRELVSAWKQVGVDMGNFTNTPAAQKILAKRALFLLKKENREKYEAFVNQWQQAGWKPNEKITRLLKNYGNG